LLTLLKLYGGNGTANQPVTIYGGSQGITWDWSGPGGFTSSEQAPLTSFVTGTYQLILTEARNGCKDTATVWVDLSTLATHDITLSGAITNGKATLQWQNQITNVNGEFIIEKGSNTSNFISIGKLNTKANTETYSFTDASSISAGIYYRIRFIQEDGKILYSNIAKLDGKSAQNSINILHKRSNASISISGMEAGNGIVHTALYSLSGKQIAAKTGKSSANNFSIEMNYPSSTAPGVYILAIYIDNKIAASKKLVL
ncbi:MAG: T9SS type A sorting domain-containing protein, partial [Sphingobacteriales bacterium]